MKPKLLVVEDERAILDRMRLALEPDYNVLTSSAEAEAIQIYRQEKPPVVTLDLSLNPLDLRDLGGMRLLEAILSCDKSTRAIVVSSNNSTRNAIAAVQLGAFDYVTKPFRLDELKVIVSRAFHLHTLLRKPLQPGTALRNGCDGIVAASDAMKDVLRSVEQLALSDVPVLIRGETGTGKQTIAEAIHLKGQRSNKPFVVFDCARMAKHLVDCELFGEGDGTGRNGSKRGKLEVAHGGTLFIDQINELAPHLRAKLLKFLQHRTVERMDGSEALDIDTRVITATNRELEKDTESDALGSELHYRLNIASVKLPPLRERKEDIVPLAVHFLSKWCNQNRKPPMTLSPEAEGALLMHSWPGNIGELERRINRSLALGPRTMLQPSDLGFALVQLPPDVKLKFAKKAIEMDFVEKALSRNYGVVSRAARELGISRVNLYELIGKYNLRLQEFKLLKTVDKAPIKSREVS